MFDSSPKLLCYFEINPGRIPPNPSSSSLPVGVAGRAAAEGRQVSVLQQRQQLRLRELLHLGEFEREAPQRHPCSDGKRLSQKSTAIKNV